MLLMVVQCIPLESATEMVNLPSVESPPEVNYEYIPTDTGYEYRYNAIYECDCKIKIMN